MFLLKEIQNDKLLFRISEGKIIIIRQTCPGVNKSGYDMFVNALMKVICIFINYQEQNCSRTRTRSIIEIVLGIILY